MRDALVGAKNMLPDLVLEWVLLLVGEPLLSPNVSPALFIDDRLVRPSGVFVAGWEYRVCPIPTDCTRSGKIMRRLLRDIAAGRESTGDQTMLEDGGVLERLRG